MQRWVFMDDQANDASSSSSKWNIGTDMSSPSTMTMRQITFKVVYNKELLPSEGIAVTGNWDTLGNWQPQNCVQLKQSEESSEWKAIIDLPRDREIKYRYFVCAVDPNGNILVRNWETHFNPRKLPELYESNEITDIYGDYDGVQKIDRGWLTNETILQLKFFNAPFKWKQKLRNRTFFVKVTPMALRIHSDVLPTITSLEDSLSNDTRETNSDVQTFAFSEVVSVNCDENTFQSQEQFGIQCGLDDIVIFHITVSDFDNVTYLIDLYASNTKSISNETPTHIGYHYILPNLLKRSEGTLESPITCATKHRPMGMMQFGYIKIKPFLGCKFDLQKSYQRYWNKKWTGLDVGHRGSGTSFKTKDSVIRENTIYSLKNAASHGADMVEFDVQLSKDLVPVIYHDFNVSVSLKAKGLQEMPEFLELPMNELTLEQLKNFKVYHLVEGRTREPRNFQNDDWLEHQPFPQLSDAFDLIDHHVGFNIEIKWSQELADGTSEAGNTIDRNLYVDCILDVVIRKAGDRRIVFSCFDPDICAMIRYKQNIYPVMFLTLGQTVRYTKYLDPRCNTTELAICNARAMEFLGIVAHTEDLLRDPTKVDQATKRGLIVFCWGDENNSQDTILQLKKMGLHAIIYDKMDVLIPKTNKESVFLVQARDTQNELLKLQCLETCKMDNNSKQQCHVKCDKLKDLENDRATLIEE